MNLSLWQPMETDETIRTIVTNSTDSIFFKVITPTYFAPMLANIIFMLYQCLSMLFQSYLEIH